MKKIFQFLLIAVTAGFALSSCEPVEEAYSTVPNLVAPTAYEVAQTTATLKIDKPRNGRFDREYVVLSKTQDMRDTVRFNIEYQTVQISYRRSESIPVAKLNGLSPNTTYYAQYAQSVKCESEGVYEVTSPVMTFKTSEFAPTNFHVQLSGVPYEGSYGFFIEGGGGSGIREYSSYSSYNPETKITDVATVYATMPDISSATSPKSVPLYGGTDFSYAVGKVSPSSPSITLTPRRYTAHVNVNVSFRATKEDPYNVYLQSMAITNVSGNRPICLDGTLDLTTRQFTPSQSSRTQYVNTSSSYVSGGKTTSRSFYGVIPVSFGANAVKVVLTMSGDIVNKEAAIVLPAATWGEGSDVNVNLTAEYTAQTVTLSVSSVEVIPWSEGSNGNIEIKK